MKRGMSMPARPLAPLRGTATTVARRTLLGIGGVRSHVSAAQREIALTFDDGPDSTFTPRLLDTLERLNVRATFFLVGRAVEEHPSLAREIASRGHAVGSHSYSHPDPWRLAPMAIVREYRGGREVLEGVLGRSTRLFRPPKGHVDVAGVAAMRAAGLRPWLWSIDSHDWEPDASRGSVEGRLGAVGPGDVVLFHDNIQGPLAPSALDRTVTIDLLPSFVARLRAGSANFTTLL